METRGEPSQLSSGIKLLAFFASGVSVYLFLSLVYVGMRSYHEMRYWEALDRAAPFAVQARLAEDAQELERAPLPISESKRLLATSGRAAFPSIRPTSAPRPPLPGWVHHPDFERGVQAVEQWRRAHETNEAASAAARGQEAP